MFLLFLLVLNLTTAEEEKVEEGGTGEERKDAIAKILSMDSDVFKNTVNGCTQVLETTSETDPLLIAHRVVDIADVDDWGKELDSMIISSDFLSDICMDQFHP